MIICEKATIYQHIIICKAEESFSEPSYVVVNETVKQLPGGVLAEISHNSIGSSGANTSFEGPPSNEPSTGYTQVIQLSTESMFFS